MIYKQMEQRVRQLEAQQPPQAGEHTYVVDIAPDDPQYLIDGQGVSYSEFLRQAPTAYEVELTP